MMRIWFLGAFMASLSLAGQGTPAGQGSALAAAQSVAPNAAPPAVEIAWPKEVDGSIVYSLAASQTAPASLHLRDASGEDHLIASGKVFGQSGSGPDPANGYGPFALTSDGQKVIYCSYTAFLPQQPGVVPFPAPISLVGIFAVALGNAIAGSMMGAGEIRNTVGIYEWDRATGKTELLWDAKALDLQSNVWSKNPPIAAIALMGKFHLSGELPAACSQIINLGGSSFLVITPRSVVKLNAATKELTPIWADARMNSNPPQMFQDGDGVFRVVFRNQILCVDPKSGVRMSEVFGSPTAEQRAVFRGPNTVYFTDGKQVRECLLQDGPSGQSVVFKEVAVRKIKNDILVPERSGSVFAIRQSAYGDSSLAKVLPDGKVAWNTSFGPSRGPVMLSENDGRLYALVCQPSTRSGADIPLRVVFDAATGALKDMDNWQTAPASVKENNRVPVGPASIPFDENWSGTDVFWLPATARAADENALTASWKAWSEGPEKKRALDPRAGAWSVLNPDLTATPLVVLDRGERMIRLKADGRELYFTGAMGWFAPHPVEPQATPVPTGAPR